MEDIKISGMWNIENRQYKGELYILKNKKMIRLLLQYVDTTNPFINEDTFPENIDLIYGTSFIDNIPMTLLDCVTLRKNSNWNSGKISILIDCKFCIYGLLFKNVTNVKLNKIRVRLTNTIEWSGLNGFSSNFKKIKRKKPINLKYEFKNKIVYKINNNVKIEFVPWLGKHDYLLNTERITLEQYITVDLIYKKIENFNNIIKLLNQIILLIEMSTNTKIEITRIDGFKNSLYYKIPQTTKRILNTYRIYYAKEENELSNVELTKRDNNFICSLTDIIKVNGLNNWFEKIDDLMTIVKLYNKKFEYNIGKEQEFLNIVQALEFYHTRFVIEKLEDFTKEINEKYSKQLSLLEYIFDKDQKRVDYITLKNRLIDLILSSNILFFFNKIINFCYFVNSVTDTRHYYTHYGTGKKFKALKDAELHISIFILNTLLEYFLLKELGFKEGYLEKVTRDRLNKVRKTVIPYNEQKNLEIYDRVNLITSIKNISLNICKDCNLGTYINEKIIEDNEQDLFFYLETNKGRFKIRIFNKSKKDDECNNIVLKNRKKLVYTTRHFYELIYFYERYRIIIYKVEK